MALLGLDTNTKRGVFFLYMGLWSALRLIIYGSKQANIGYNSTTLLIFVAVVKLCMATGMYLQHDGTIADLIAQIKESKTLFLRYFLPALSYVVYDNLTFINLAISDPVTYVILMQMRIVVTGIMWSIFFHKPLNNNQWVAIALLTAACMLQKGFSDPPKTSAKEFASSASLVLSLGLIAFQIACGVFSSVFNEILLKEKGSAGVNLQNIFMYIHSIVCNVVWLSMCPTGTKWCKEGLTTAMQAENLQRLLNPWVLPIGIILASIGIVTSLFIKHLDSVRKTIASAIEIFIDAVLSFLLFGIPIGWSTVLAVFLAAAGVVMYSRPVPHPPSSPPTPNSPEEKPTV